MPQVLIGLDSPDDAAVLRPPPAGHLIVQSIDFFRSSSGADPYVFGRIAANHALSDCHAMGARPTSALALAVLPYATEAKVGPQALDYSTLKL